MKLGTKFICKNNYVYDIWNPNCYLVTYAEIEEDMEGYLEDILRQDEVLLNFYGISIVVDKADLHNGNFVSLKELSNLH